MNQRYVLMLAVLAAAVLAGGAVLRPKKGVPVEQPSPSETASLQRAVRRENLRSLGESLAEYAAAAARHVVYLPERQSSGVVWGKAGEILGPGAPEGGQFSGLALIDSTARRTGPDLAPGGEASAGWLIIAARSADGALVWSAALDGGKRPALCDGLRYTERTVNVPLNRELLGAGVFDLDGRLAGVVSRCGDSYLVIAAPGIGELLARGKEPAELLWARHGLRVTPASEEAKALFGEQSGVLVAEVSHTGSAYAAGLRAGDLIAAAGERKALSAAEVAAGLEAGAKLTVFQPGRRLPAQLTVSREVSAGGIIVMQPLPGASRVAVARDTPAYRAGLRTGDAVLQVGARRAPGAAQLQRALQAKGDPVLVVYRHEGTDRAVWVKP